MPATTRAMNSTVTGVGFWIAQAEILSWGVGSFIGASLAAAAGSWGGSDAWASVTGTHVVARRQLGGGLVDHPRADRRAR